MTEVQPTNQPEFTARDAAKDLIRPYVKRGDEEQWLREGRMGSYSDRYAASIGGVVRKDGKVKGIGPDRIVVERLGDRMIEPPALYSLHELYQEIQDEDDPTKFTQGRLF